ncbi:MAG TPA: hypothetical protein VKG80_23715 [Trebonia sp.]|nr:hypothetical protein [Trebonia sp.]
MARLRSVTDVTVIERSGEQEREMAMRIILASGCLAIGAAVIALTGTATQATTLSGAQGPSPTTTVTETVPPTPTYSPTTSPTATVTASATATVTASATATVTAIPTATPVPTVAPVTGGGGSIVGGGLDTPLVAGGAAAAVAGAGLALLAFRRWRRDRAA